jgi:transposase
MVVRAALDEQGRPVACELFAGNATDVKLFSPTIKAL